MKWLRLFNDNRPQLKCEPLTAAALAQYGIPAAINTVGNIFSSLNSRDAQAEENQKNRDWSEMMWNKQNEYNSPANQRKLLEDAGYNPYLLTSETPYSGGTASVPSAPSSQPLPSMVNPMQGVSSFMQLFQQGMQVESNVQLQRMKALESIADITTKLLKEGGPDKVNEFLSTYAPFLNQMGWQGSFYEKMFNEQLRGMQIENDKNKLQKELIDKYGDKQASKQLEFIDAQINKFAAEVGKFVSEKRLNYKKIEELGSEMAKNFAEAHLFNWQSSQISTLLPYIRSVMENNSMIMEYEEFLKGMEFEDKEADFIQGEETRKLKKSKYGKFENKWEYSSEHNPVFDFLRGFSKSMPGGIPNLSTNQSVEGLIHGNISDFIVPYAP